MGRTQTGIKPLRNALQRIASLQLQGKNGYEAELAQLLTHDRATLDKWGAPLTQEERADRNNAIFDHWLAGETVTEIATKLHLRRQVVQDRRCLQPVQHDPGRAIGLAILRFFARSVAGGWGSSTKPGRSRSTAKSL